MEGDITLSKVGKKIFVNALTVSRLVFTFVMPFLFNKILSTTFIWIVIALYTTDWFDGFLSRKFGVQTLFGSIMDTVADKVLCIILIVCIPNKHWSLFAMMIGEIIIGVMNLFGTLNGASIKSIMVGRAKMWVLAAATVFGYMHYYNAVDVNYVIAASILAIIMQVVVLFGYGSKIRKVGEVNSERVKFKRGKDLAHALFDTEFYLETVDEPILKKLTK